MNRLFSLLLPVTALCLPFLTGCNRVTAENVARVKPGMSAAEVKEIMGDAMGTSTGEKSQTFSYRSDKLWVFVECRRGKVAKVLTREASRDIVPPARNTMPSIDLTLDSLNAQLNAVLKEGGTAALAEWMKRELVPGRPAKASGGREVLVADSALAPLDADGFADFSRAVVAPTTDEHIWFSKFSTAVIMSWNETNPPVQLHVLVTR